MKKIGAVIALIAVVGGALGWYFGYHTKTPAYSVGLILESVKNHDSKQFQKHVDLDGILTHSIDDLVVSAVGQDTRDSLGKDLAKGVLSALKPAIVSGLKEAVVLAVEYGPDAEKRGVEKPVIGSNEMEKETGIRDARYEGIDYVKEDDGVAMVGIRINEPDLGDYVIELKMEKLSDKTWKVTEITNFHDYIVKLGAARLAALKRYLTDTKPLFDQYDADMKKLSTGEIISAELVDRMIENRESLLTAVAGVVPPHAARELADMKTSQLSSVLEYLKAVRQSLAGDMSPEVAKRIRESEEKSSRLSREIENMEYSIRTAE